LGVQLLGMLLRLAGLKANGFRKGQEQAAINNGEEGPGNTTDKRHRLKGKGEKSLELIELKRTTPEMINLISGRA
jgi:hypothetical protein